MVIVKILGGFASQLGKYSFGSELAKGMKTELVIDISDYLNGYFRPFMLGHVSIPNNRVVNGIAELENVVVISNGEELIAEYEKEKKRNIYIYREEKDYELFFKKYPQLRLGSYSAVFQNFSMRVPSDYIQRFEQKISNQISIAVHIRRGDFVKLNLQDEELEYKQIIGYLMTKYVNAEFYFFSNDITWVKEQFGKYERFNYIENHNGNIGDVEEFICMAMCNLRILSSYSGYGQYANYLSINKYNGKGAYCTRSIENGDGIFYINKEQRNVGEQEYKAYVEHTVQLTEYKNVEYISLQIDRIKIEDDYIGYSQNRKEEFWRNEYGIKKGKNSLIVISIERYDVWRWNGMLQLARVYARCGYRVLYININTGNKNDECIVCAKNMDGKNQGFDIAFCSGEKTELTSILLSWHEKNPKNNVISDILVSIPYSYIMIKRKMTRNTLYYYARQLHHLHGITIPQKYYKYEEKTDQFYQKQRIGIANVSDKMIEADAEKKEIKLAHKITDIME